MAPRQLISSSSATNKGKHVAGLATPPSVDPALSEQDLPYEASEVDYDDFDEFDYDPSKNKPAQVRFYRRKKFWVFCGLFTILFLAIIIPIAIYVIVPAIAQSMLNSSIMQVVQLNMTQPTETNVQVSVWAQVSGIPSIFSAEMEFTEPVSVVFQDNVLGAMTLQSVKVSGGKGDLQQQSVLTIEDANAFTSFAKVMLGADSFNWTLRSKATLKVLGLTIKNLKVNKDLGMNGLGNFANVKILSFNLPADAPDGNGALIAIEAQIPNPSPIGMTLGTITLDLHFQTAYIGQVVAQNVVLIPGQLMSLNMTGLLFKQTDPVHLQELSLLMSNYLANLATLTTAKGVSVFPDGKNSVSWLTAAIASTTMTVPLVATEPLNVIQNIVINDMSLIMTPAEPWAPQTSSNQVDAVFKLPFNISINITDLANATLTLSFNNVQFADLSGAVWNSSLSDVKNNKIVLTLPQTGLMVRDSDLARSTYMDFLADVTQQSSLLIEVSGQADSVASTSLGVVRLRVPFKSPVTLTGMSLSTASPIISNVMAVGGTVDTVQLTADVTLANPSVFAVELGPVKLTASIEIDGRVEYIGDVLVTNLKLINQGSTALGSRVIFQPLDKDFGNQFLSAFMAGSSTKAFIAGLADSSVITSLSKAMGTLKMQAAIPGMTPKPNLINQGFGTPTIGSILGNRQIPLSVDAVNPLNTTLFITSLSANVTWEGNFFGSTDGAGAPAFEVPPGVMTRSPVYVLQCPLGLQFGLFLVTQFLPKNLDVLTGGTVPVDMVAVITVAVGGPVGAGYEATIQYSQNAVPAFLTISFSFAGLVKRMFAIDRQSVAISDEWDAGQDQYLSKLYAQVVAKVGPEPEKHTRGGRDYVEWVHQALLSVYDDPTARL